MTKRLADKLTDRSAIPAAGLDIDAIYVTHQVWPGERRKSTGNAFCWRERQQDAKPTKTPCAGKGQA